MQLSDNGRTLIKGFEGLSLKAYRDPPISNPAEQLWSIGYGHQLGKGPSWEGHTISRDEADRYFDQDARKFETAVSFVTPVAQQHEFDAMVSLAYNIGTGNTTTKQNGFAGSTVARLHNAGDRMGAADAFRMWNKAGGAVHQGLVARREKERNFYLHGTTTPGSFPAPLPPASTESGGWPPIATAPEAPNSKAYAGASIASLLTLAVGWVVYRLINR